MTATTNPAPAHGGAVASPVIAPLPVASGRQVATHVTRLLRLRYGRRFAVSLALQCAAAAVALGPSVLLGRMVDMLVGAGGASTAERLGAVNRFALAIAALLLVHAALTWMGRVTMGVLAEQVLAGLREDFVRDVVHLPLSTVELAGTGDLISRTSADIDAVDQSLSQSVPAILGAAVSIVAILAGAVWVSPVMALGVLVVLPVMVPVLIWYRRRSPQAFARVRAGLAAMTATISESSTGARTVEALRWERRRRRLLDDQIAQTWRSYRRTIGLRTVLFPATDLTMFLPLLAALLIGGALALRGNASVGEVTTVAILMQMIMAPMTQIVLWLDNLQMGNAGLARIVGVGTVASPRGAENRAPTEEPDADIRMADVRFGYTPEHPVLHGIDLTLRRGERLALVGATGAGKSTLARLIAGIHAPDTGSVTVGGVHLVELSPERLRQRVALVTQEHHVFVGTLADNLRLASPRATDDELIQALARVGATGWLSRLPEGLDTQLAGDHLAPTPAEAQSIALARLAVAAPPTLVLDEATSQLDAGAAQRAESSLAEVLRGRTVVMIAHRLHTAHDADRIGVIEQGRLVELGTHDQLLSRRGAYHRLWETWHGRPTAQLEL